ncbi:CRISPR-associated protein, Csh1 family (plasmid) [Halorubrum lacusprofundi ATCC 49239]|jgi:CRISPR-associated protein Cas8b/Csh1 subtype I-B|uniref:CRISPR-associated protein, Csh1 family n=1 Tax=Halorubrum lacusprofundi (strain ATCC 49239 / DSM 5036 / JCM 8891 / ACAM 34) TaxID=416348 RepID=B9LWL2_HALLT|nr:type I-B CRISPR-associated protein Cas8b/Csh1 [Halorubrum lacusprofundi]ACM58853.1 CRISPR-associated protein, Csh1 family [Halorubrum lacusprofundi ATCC 49239]
MSGPTREDFAAAIDDYWHGRPPTSLEDVMSLYGVLAVAESGGSLYGTPSTLDPFIDDGRLVVIDLDLTGDEPTYEQGGAGISVDTLRTDDIAKLAYSHKSSGRGAKYSLTQIGSKNGNDASGVAGTILRRVRSWTNQDSVQSITGDNGHPDAWVIETLDKVFTKDGETLERIQSDIESLLPTDDSVPTVLTVRCRINDTDLSTTDNDDTDWFWPADLDVLNRAMRRYATANATDKNISSGPASEGEAVGVVTDQVGRVVGTPESPLEVFSVKHPDAQPGLRRDQSWRNYPVSADVAMLFSKGQDLIERCVLRRGGVETYTLPYFAGELTELKAETLYRAIHSLDSESEYTDSSHAPMARVTYEIQENDDPAVRALKDEIRFYVVSLPISDDKNIIAEEPSAGIYWVSELAKSLVDTVQGPTLSPESGGFRTYDNWDLLDFPDETGQARNVAFGKIVGHTFTDAVFAYRDEEGDDFRRIVDHRLIAGVPLDASMLFSEYMQRWGDEFDGDDPVPQQVIAQQLVHLESLSRAGLLTGLDAAVEPTDTETMTAIEDTDTDLSNLAAIRKYRLESFLDRPMFTENAERKATALAGVLVGQISWHQADERDLGRPLDSKTRGDQLTKNGLEQAVKTALEKAKVYAHDSKQYADRDILFPETVDLLLETTEQMPTKWEIDKRDLQFAYVLGHAHGRRSMPNAFDLYKKDDASEESEAAESPAN